MGADERPFFSPTRCIFFSVCLVYDQVTGKSAWNYALHLASDTDLKSALTFIQGIMPLTASPYHLATVPVHLLAKVISAVEK